MEQSQAGRGLYVQVAADYRKRRMVLGWLKVIALAGLTVALLSVIQEPVGWSWLAWVSLVPWVLAAVGAPKGGRAALVNYAAGFIYFAANLYWLTWVTLAGYLGLCFYLGWYFVLCGFILRRVYHRWRWPFTLVLPVLWVGQEYLRASLMTGFAWFFLGHSQHDHPALLQNADLFGAYGLTFLVAMVNGFICDLLLRPLVKTKTSTDKGQGRAEPKIYLSAGKLALIVAAGVAAAILYGRYRLEQGNHTITAGPAAAMVQDAIPQYVKESGSSDEEIFARHLQISREALTAPVRPDLVVWPETMAPAPLKAGFLNFSPRQLSEFGEKLQAQSQTYDRRLRDLAREQGSWLLIGAAGLELPPGEQLRFNSAFLYQPDGGKAWEEYSKMHLVPFGEVVPFKHSWPRMYEFLSGLTPYDYEYSLEAGRRATRFEITAGDGKKYSFAVAICYEDVMPPVPRQLTKPDASGNKADFLLNISNDGWFVRGGKNGQPVKASTELIQHMVAARFRAVENRVAVARAVNTGISGFIRPDGVIQGQGQASTLAADYRARQAVAGYITDTIYLDGRRSPYQKMGDIFSMVCTGGLSLLFILCLLPGKKVKSSK